MRKTGPHGEVKLDRSVLHLLHRAGQCADVVFTDAAIKMDITPRQLVVLSAIAANPRSSQTAIVNATGIDRSTLAEMVRRLESRKLIQRKRSKTDARAYVVDLTEQGHRILRDAGPMAEQVDAVVLNVLGRKRRDELVRALEKMISGMTAE
ncbi:MAG: hypothetical protein RLZ98_3089 [Pseudomonadota bacterium]|jgi:DNA-binding MarR family transcriptional regulator